MIYRLIVAAIISLGLVCGCTQDRKLSRAIALREGKLGSEARDGVPEQASSVDVLDQMELGMSHENIASAVASLYVANDKRRFMEKYPLAEMLPYKNSLIASEWVPRSVHVVAEQEVIIGIFRDGRKLELIDAFMYNGDALVPLVDGPYNRTLVSLRNGSSVIEVYERLGRREGEYFLDADGVWRVRFVYLGFRGRVFVVEVDACSGRVSSVKEATI